RARRARAPARLPPRAPARGHRSVPVPVRDRASPRSPRPSTVPRATRWPPTCRAPRNTRARSALCPCLPFHPLLELPRERLRFALAAADHENRVLAADRADDIGQLGPIDRLGERRRLRRLGPEHDELLDDVEPLERPRDGPPERGGPVHPGGRLARRRALVSPVLRALYEAEFADVPREGRLRDLDPLGQEPLPQLLLAGDGLPVDQLDHKRLPIGLHKYSVEREIIHSLHRVK